MSGIDEGVETQADFAQAVQDAGLVEWLTDSDPGEQVAETPQLPDTDTPVERPRDEQGRFTKVESDEDGQSEETAEAVDSDDPTVDAATETAEDGQQEDADEDGDIVLEIDEDLQAVLDKYDGDIGKALRALGDSQSMIGRQGNELGQLRSELQQLRDVVQRGFQAQPQAPQFVGPYINNIDENPQGLVMEALERGDGRTLEAAMRAWGEIEPFEAATFLFTLQQQAAAPAAPQAAPTTAHVATGPSVEEAMAEVVARHPDVEKYLPQVGQIAEEFPTLRDSMRAGSPTAQAQAFEELLKIAKARSVGSDTSAAMKRVILKTAEEVRKEKADAAVVSAQNQTAAKPGDRLDAFYQAFGEAAERYESSDWITRSND